MNVNIQDLIIELHNIAREQSDMRIDSRLRKVADDLSNISKEYRLCSLEEAEEFARKRNYDYTNS